MATVVVENYLKPILLLSDGSEALVPMDGPAPAILKAIENATEISSNRIPLMPEAMMEPLVSIAN